jgi:hypothetical protein
MDNPNTQIHDRSLSLLGTGISIKGSGVILVHVFLISHHATGIYYIILIDKRNEK